MNGFKTAFLMALMMVLFLFVGNLLGGETGLLIAFVFSLALNFGSYWFSDKLVLAMYRAKEVSEREAPELHKIVENLSYRANILKPKVYVMNNENPNAFATGRNPENGAVAVTTGIMRILSKDELEGVIAHELTHIKNRDILVSTIAATLVGTITLIARMAGWAAILGGGRDDRDGGIIGDLALMILAPLIAILIQLAISRSREYMADEGGAKISGKPLGLASALNKLKQAGKAIPMRNAETSSAHMFIVNPLSGKSLMKLFSTHPPIEERVNRLREIANGRR
ncbi:MAG: zinc metalloprotease HtpX [Ignavibacteria bacterium]|jgi:heat shock protein HtpX